VVVERKTTPEVLSRDAQTDSFPFSQSSPDVQEAGVQFNLGGMDNWLLSSSSGQPEPLTDAPLDVDLFSFDAMQVPACSTTDFQHFNSDFEHLAMNQTPGMRDQSQSAIASASTVSLNFPSAQGNVEQSRTVDASSTGFESKSHGARAKRFRAKGTKTLQGDSKVGAPVWHSEYTDEP